jgi:hypothetical protein
MILNFINFHMRTIRGPAFKYNRHSAILPYTL